MIGFAIPAATDPGCNAVTGVCTIALNFALPVILKPLEIDGYSQPGAFYNTLAGTDYPGAQALNTELRIEIDGSGGGSMDGIVLGPGSDGSQIRGLAIGGFPSGYAAIHLWSSSNRITGNFIGMRADGLTTAPAGIGVLVETLTSGNRIGTDVSVAAERNLIAANLDTHVHVRQSNNNVIGGNLIGTDRSGTIDHGVSTGVWVYESMGNVVAGNVIAGGSLHNVWLMGAQNTSIARNSIGIGVGGVALGSQTGIHIENSPGSVVSQDNLVDVNGIGNSTWGIRVTNPYLNGDPIRNRLDNNAIFAITHTAIDLAPGAGEPAPYVTANDAPAALDADSGPNGLQNYPVITSAVVNGSGGIDISFTLDSAANETYAVSAYANPSCHPSGHGEGRHRSGIVTPNFSTNAGGHATGTITVPAPLPAGWAAGQFVALLARSVSTLDTSEFSACAQVAAAPPPPPPPGTAPTITSITPPGGVEGVPYSFQVTASGTAPIAFSDGGTLPAGLSIDPNSGLISGGPMVAGSYNVTITAANGVLPNATQTFAMTILSQAVAGNPQPIPTLGEWGRLLLASLLALGTPWLARRKWLP